MKIIKLQSENIKRIKAISIQPDGAVVRITGKNGSGKSSTLDSIAMCLGGEKLVCPKPVRAGEKKAKIVIDLGDLIVTRTFTEAGGGNLIVANKDGARYPGPQAVLDKLVGRLTFDPLTFSRMDAKKQAEELRRLTGLDFTELDTQRKRLYTDRTSVNQTIAIWEGQLHGMPFHAEANTAEVSVADLVEELQRRQQANSKNEKTRALISDLESIKMRVMAEIAQSEQSDVTIAKDCAVEVQSLADELEQRIKQVREEYARKLVRLQSSVETKLMSSKNLRQKLIDQKSSAEQQLATLSAKEIVDVDLGSIRTQISGAEVENRLVRENAKHLALQAQIEETRADAKGLTDAIEAIDAKKLEMLAAAPFPVPGLAFDENGVTFNGIPFSQASSAEQLRVSVAMGFAMNPKLRVLLIRDGSLLDSDGLRLVSEMAEQHDGQIWLEQVSEDKTTGIVIEDGMVAGAVPETEESVVAK